MGGNVFGSFPEGLCYFAEIECGDGAPVPESESKKTVALEDAGSNPQRL